ncbi:MAG: glucuronate isomerase [Planctomycetota bacterium]|jgi:glucuronate isomerase|nr:glucuronate isomerase [Planctomycetota bacterium]
MSFMHEDFLLETELARSLYHSYAKSLPIIDYHCHLPPEDVASNKQYRNLAEIWLGGDHYKWRAMRTAGVDERYCTGDASDWDKFEQWAAVVPRTLRNPLYHWTHLELKKPFGISDRLLDPSTAKGVWDHCNELLATPEFTARGLMTQWEVEVVCTTDDPADSLEHHIAAAKDGCATLTLPTWRPDKAMATEDPASYNAYLDKLAVAADTEISDWASLLDALNKRHDFFHSVGCRLSDHGLEHLYAEVYTQSDIELAFTKVRGGGHLSPEETLKLKSAVLYELALMDHAKGWTQQFHVGAMRNNNARLFKALGPDTGFDSIGGYAQAAPMSAFFSRLDATDQLARSIIYNLNPSDNDIFATMIGNYQDGSIAGKMQFGSGWWFNDQWDGMTKQIESLSNMGLLSCFVGMLTDSRSFLSYARHEYFRRLLCNILGNDVKRGALPNDEKMLGQLVANVSYHNARNYFKFHQI